MRKVRRNVFLIILVFEQKYVNKSYAIKYIKVLRTEWSKSYDYRTVGI